MGSRGLRGLPVSQLLVVVFTCHLQIVPVIITYRGLPALRAREDSQGHEELEERRVMMGELEVKGHRGL